MRSLMGVHIGLLVVLFFTDPALTTPILANFTEKYFDQKIDHFSYSNNLTFKQRYIISTDHWKANAPIFFYAGNEGDIYTFANNTGFMWDNAAKFNAMVVFMEHRYYGTSMPYGNKSFSGLANLGYLTVEQALADFADFLIWLKNDLPGAVQSPVVVFGGSYGGNNLIFVNFADTVLQTGMLATWFRMKYPHIVIGALAASAPILQFPGIYDCHGYYKIATKDFENYSPLCSQSIRNSWAAFHRLAKTDEGRAFLTHEFSLCKPLNEQEVQSFVAWVSSTWDTLAMIDYPNPANFLQPLPAYPIKHVCQHLVNPNADDQTLIKSIASAASVFYNYTGQVKCNNIGGDSDRLGLDGWNFQACTEMILPVCSDGVTDMFEKNPWNFSSFSANCKQQYGLSSDKYKALIMFGGDHIKSLSNIIFSNGLRDPWSAGGVNQSLSDTLIAIQIPGACHHEDLRSAGPNDPKPLIEARAKELKIISGWIKDYYNQNNISFERDW